MDIQIGDVLIITAGDAAAMDLHGKMRPINSTKNIWWEHAHYAANNQWVVIVERLDNSGKWPRVRQNRYDILVELEVNVDPDNLSVLRDFYGV